MSNFRTVNEIFFNFDVKAENLDTGAALLWAACHGPSKDLKFLLERGADFSVRLLRSGYTALHVAAIFGRFDAISLLLKAGFNIEERCLINSRTALHVAAERGWEETVQLLIRKGAFIDERDERGSTALALAAESGRLKVVKILIKAGVDLETTTDFGYTAMHNAARGGHEDVVKLLSRTGADVHAKDIDGWTALHWAAANGHLRIICVLLEVGANVHEVDIAGRTASIVAMEKDEQSAVRLFREKIQKNQGNPRAPSRIKHPFSLRTIPNDYSRYTALDQAHDEIRLLRIEAFPGDNNMLTCRIVRTSLQDHPRFTALSYNWGNLDDTTPISMCFDDHRYVDSSSTPNISRRTERPGHVITDFHITTNLYNALRSFQHHDSSLFIWNDMLCINQGNLSERSQQVTVMSRIYTAAAHVTVWLGGDPDVNSDVLSLDQSEDLDIFIHLLKKHSSLEGESLSSQWASMCSSFVENDDYHDSFSWNEVEQSFEIPYKSVATDLYWMYTSLSEETTELVQTKKSKGVVSVESYFYDAVLSRNSLVLRLATFLSLDHESTFNQEQAASWQSLFNVLQRWYKLFYSPWFSRVWVIQEIANSKMAYIRYDNMQTGWNSLLNYHLIYKAMESVWSTQRYQMTMLLPQFSVYLNGTLMRWYALWEEIDNLKQEKLSFLSIIRKANDFLSTDPRDRIYAIALLANDIVAEELVPDYSQSLEVVFAGFTNWFLRQHETLRPLSLCRNFHEGRTGSSKRIHRLENLPSWCPDYRDINCIQINGSDDSEEIHNACRGQPARFLDGNNPMSLHVQGILIARVMGVKENPETSWATIWPELRVFLPDSTKQSSTTDQLTVLKKSFINLKSYIRTLGVNLTGRQELEVFAQKVLETDAAFEFDPSWSESHFLQKYNTGIHNKRELEDLFTVNTCLTRENNLFISHDNRLGLGPKQMKNGDIVAILMGSNVPFILREKKLHSNATPKELSKWLQEGSVYQLIGECYLDGRMNGKILKDPRFDDPLNIDPLEHDSILFPGYGENIEGERFQKGVYRKKFFHLQ